MSNELIERLAKDAGLFYCAAGVRANDDKLRKFASLVAEECAKIAANTYEGGCNSEDGDSGYDFNGDNSAEAIRAKFT